MYKKISDEIVNKIVSEINKNGYDALDAQETDVEINGVTYNFRSIEDSGWESDDRGKYDDKTIIFQLVKHGKEYNTIYEFDVYFEQSSSRSGSYYTEYTYGYDKLVRLKRVEKVIPEQVIPEHTVVAWEKY